MAAKCAIYLLGGIRWRRPSRKNIPKPFACFVKSCLFGIPERRPQDAWMLHNEFDESIVKPYFGAPRFVELAM